MQIDSIYDELQIVERAEETLEDKERMTLAVPMLLSWYDRHARILPWREKPEPYRVWVSEIMLQQTRVEAVRPYFERFMAELPDIRSLAEVSEERLFKLWEGLGYYNRARNLKQAACLLIDDYQGKMPEKYEEIIKLPGIGSYTAGAIASIANGKCVPAVDGNVLRVISRVLARRDDILKQSVKKNIEVFLAEIIPKDRPGDFNQALMETGATVCIPRGKPKCEECPFTSLCLSKRYGLTEEIPVKTKKKERRIEKKTVFLVYCGDKLLLGKRPEKGLLSGMYELPNAEGWLSAKEADAWLKKAGKSTGNRHMPVQEENTIAQGNIRKLDSVTHIFSHVEWHMRGYAISVNEEKMYKGQDEKQYFFVDRTDLLEKYAVPGAFKAYLDYFIFSL